MVNLSVLLRKLLKWDYLLTNLFNNIFSHNVIRIILTRRVVSYSKHNGKFCVSREMARMRAVWSVLIRNFQGLKACDKVLEALSNSRYLRMSMVSEARQGQ